jgi:hypothetical protein
MQKLLTIILMVSVAQGILLGQGYPFDGKTYPHLRFLNAESPSELCKACEDRAKTFFGISTMAIMNESKMKCDLLETRLAYAAEFQGIELASECSNIKEMISEILDHETDEVQEAEYSKYIQLYTLMGASQRDLRDQIQKKDVKNIS